LDQVNELQTIKGGIRLDIRRDDVYDRYQISDAEQSDDSYDLDGRMFKFMESDEGEVLYQFVEIAESDMC